MYDVTAGSVRTPLGVGKFVSYKHGKVTVEFDYERLVEFDGNKVYIIKEVKPSEKDN